MADWVEGYRQFWNESLDGLDGYLRRAQRAAAEGRRSDTKDDLK